MSRPNWLASDDVYICRFYRTSLDRHSYHHIQMLALALVEYSTVAASITTLRVLYRMCMDCIYYRDQIKRLDQGLCICDVTSQVALFGSYHPV
jgi:hypothetical protein